MFHREHSVPHFHAVYGGQKMSVEIETGRLHGALPIGPQRLVLAWTWDPIQSHAMGTPIQSARLPRNMIASSRIALSENSNMRRIPSIVKKYR